MATDAAPQVAAIQVGRSRIEYHRPDLALAYATLAPKVSEAWAYLRCGDTDAAKAAVEAAQAVIDATAAAVTTIEMVSAEDQE